MLNNMDIPKVKIKCKSIIKGSNGKNLIIPKLNIIKIGIIIIKPSKKFIKLDKTTEIGTISLGITN
jgi:hypothetical protein